MKFSLWTQYGALNSKPVFDAFRHSLVQAGHTVHDNDPSADVDVIWSVLWSGRMSANKAILDSAQAQSKPVIVLEVGGIIRGTTWKVGLNGINKDAFFVKNADSSRANSLGLMLTPWRTQGDHILVCGQHDRSLQWQNMPNMSQWFIETIKEVRKYSNRKIVIRPHPRCPISSVETQFKNVIKQLPAKRPGTYDDYDIRFTNAHAVISWSSNPGIRAAINGYPVFTGPISLAYPVANHNLADIEIPQLPERQQWLNDLAHTEWTIQEISQGLPLAQLTNRLG
jgi:hypothetical protein